MIAITPQKTLVLGNSINRLSVGRNAGAGLSWEQMILELLKRNNLDTAIYKYDKPITVLFHEIILLSKGDPFVKEREIKKCIREIFENMLPNDYHRFYLRLGFKNIITTNYDKCLENDGSVYVKQPRETKFSLFRRYNVNDTKIWHAHGEITRPNSIMLGYSHYIAYVSEMYKYLTVGTTTRKAQIKSPMEYRTGHKLKKEDVEAFDKNGREYSWVDLFLRDEIYIVGLELNQAEIDLWWLIIHKEMLRRVYPFLSKTKYFDFVDDSASDEIKTKKEAIHEQLKNIGVDVREIKLVGKNYQSGHDEILKKLKNGLKR